MRVFLVGIVMGFCDLIPGVSGATIAYLFGMYPKLVRNIHNMNSQLIKNLFLLRFGEVKKQIDVAFIFTLLSGILLSIFTFCHLTRILMMNPYGYSSLIGLFFGLVGLMSINQIKRLEGHLSFHAKFLPIGFFSFYGLSFLLNHIVIVNFPAGLISPIWIISGLVTSFAALLPGISGAFILFLLGLYGPLIEALSFAPFGHLPSIYIIANFILGTVAGVLLCGRLLHKLMQRFEVQTKLFLSGFTLAAIFSLTRFFYQFQGIFLALALLFVGVGIMMASVFNKWRYEPS